MGDLQNAWVDGDGAVCYWAVDSTSSGRRIDPPSGFTVRPSQRPGHVIIEALPASPNEPALIEEVPLSGIRRQDLGALFAPAALVDDATGAPCWAPFDGTAPAIRSCFGPAGGTETRPRAVSGGVGYTVRLRNGSTPAEVSYVASAMRMVSIASRLSANMDTYSLEILCPDKVRLRALVCGARVYPIAPTRAPLEAAVGACLRIDGVTAEAQWLSVALLDPSRGDVVAAGVFDLTFPGLPVRGEPNDDVVVALDADEVALAASVGARGPTGMLCGSFPAEQLTVQHAVGARLRGASGHLSPAAIGPWIFHTHGDVSRSLGDHAVLLSAHFARSRAVNLRVSRSPTHTADAGYVRRLDGAIALRLGLLANGTGTLPRARLQPIATGAEVESHSAALGARSVCDATPASYGLAFGAHIDLRQNEVRLGLCVRSQSRPPVLIGTLVEPFGVAPLLRALDAILALGRPTKYPRTLTHILRDLRAPHGAIAPAALRHAEATSQRFYALVGELAVRFTAGLMRADGRLAKELDRWGGAQAPAPVSDFLGRGLFWLRMSFDGWGFATLYPDPARLAFVPHDGASRLAVTVKSRLVKVLAEAGVGSEVSRVVVDAPGTSEPHPLRALRGDLLTTTLLGVHRTLGAAGLDLRAGMSRSSRWDLVGTSSLATRVIDADWTPEPDHALQALGVTADFAVTDGEGSPLGRYLANSMDDLLRDLDA